ncbi:MAG: FG-GAP-like repeat-containing protein [Myxococcota bacterium]
MRFRCFALLLLIAACDCGSEDEPGCELASDCPTGERCVDNRCVLADAGTDARVDAAVDSGADAGPDAGCESAVFCGSPPVCCGVGEECVDDACLPACESGVRCGESDCCESGQVCISASCTDPGDECVDSFDCPVASFCEPTLGRCLPQFDPVTCESTPVFGDFETTLERSLTTSEIRSDCFHAISAAVVIDLDGDSLPEIVANMACDSAWERGILRAFRGDTGEELWVAEDVDTYGRISAGAADLKGDGSVVIVTITSPTGTDPRRAVAFDAAGAELWRSTNTDGSALTIVGDNSAPTFSDLDGDGSVEVIFGAVVLDADGVLVWQQNAGGNEGTNDGYTGGITAVADIDNDGLVDVVSGRRAYERSGDLKWTATTPDGYPAVAQFDDDVQPEIALVADGSVYLLDGVTGEVQWGPVALPGGGRGGPPTVADFDGDGLPEIGVAGAGSYSVYDPDGDDDVLWSRTTQDVSSNATGSSVFDFEGDGSAEVVYQDECYIWVYAGTDGSVLLQIPSSSATIHEYPLVVDVDADGNSEIVAVANDRSSSLRASCVAADPEWDGARRGIFIYGDARDQWVRTRRVWNQHAYHVTHIGSDGRVPLVEPNNWEVDGLNNYRQNVQGEGIFNAPDLEIAGLEVVLADCPTGVTLRARVRNVGSLGVEAGVPVSFYRGPLDAPGDLIGTETTAIPLLPGASTVVSIDAPLEGDPPYEFHAVVDDDGSGAGIITECNEDGNAEDIADIDCNLLI